MKNKGTIEQQIKRLEKSIEKFGDHAKPSQVIGPKQLAINNLKAGKK